MRPLKLIICVVAIGFLVWLNVAATGNAPTYGGLTAVGWTSLALATVAIGLFVMLKDSSRALGFFGASDERGSKTPAIRVLTSGELKELGFDKYRGPIYPHPVIFPERCIGCQACVDACPHDVLAIVDGRAAAVAPDLCMEDTACQAECPVNPKACIVINTTKEVRSLPTPTRDGGSYETNVPGCYIIGDVSGVPLIKNAVKEGYEVIAHLANGVKSGPADPRAQYDVAIIGAGPGGASAATAAKKAGLQYIVIEQNNTLSTIDAYPKGKYIFFKPDTKDWFGGLPVTGLGLAKAKYGGAAGEDPIIAAIGAPLEDLAHAEAPAIFSEVISKIPATLHGELAPSLTAKIEKEIKKRVATIVSSQGASDPAAAFMSTFLPQRIDRMPAIRAEIADQLQTKIPGDQRENILSVWLGNLEAKGVRINEQESCKTVVKAADGNYFTIETERGADKTKQAYTARRVVIAVGLRGAPNKLRLPNEDLRAVINGREEAKVIYGLSNPMDFRGLDIIIVGGGNVAVEAAVDLVAVRDGSAITPRSAADMNRVTMLVRDDLAPTVKFGNKLQLYKCAGDGLIDLKFGVGIKEMREHEVIIEDVKTKQEKATIRNDYIFALIGGERPNRFLESIGIEIK